MRYQGKLYRALNPVWAREPLSGRGAAIYGGRFNPKGLPALYCSLSPVAALREANQVGDLQPTVLVSYNAEIESVFDGTNVQALAAEDLDPPTLANPAWRDAMKAGQASTQQLALRLIAAGFYGMLVPSYARGATKVDRNLVLWRWTDDLPCRLTLIDDEGRLSPQ